MHGARLLTRHFLKRVQNKLAVFLFGLTQQAAEFAYVLCILARIAPSDVV